LSEDDQSLRHRRHLRLQPSTTDAAAAPEPPAIDPVAIQRYARNLEQTLRKGKAPDIKKLVAGCVRKIRLAPESHQISITYPVP
jgi:hypothetical protein